MLHVHPDTLQEVDIQAGLLLPFCPLTREMEGPIKIKYKRDQINITKVESIFAFQRLLLCIGRFLELLIELMN
jgi:hypothetical protein